MSSFQGFEYLDMMKGWWMERVGVIIQLDRSLCNIRKCFFFFLGIILESVVLVILENENIWGLKVGTLEDKLKWCYVAPPYITSLATLHKLDS